LQTVRITCTTACGERPHFFSDEGRASAMFRLHLFSRRVIDLMYVCTCGCCS